MSAYNDTSNKPNKHQKDFTRYTKLQHIKLPQRDKQVQAMKNQFNLKRKEKTPTKRYQTTTDKCKKTKMKSKLNKSKRTKSHKTTTKRFTIHTKRCKTTTKMHKTP